MVSGVPGGAKMQYDSTSAFHLVDWIVPIIPSMLPDQAADRFLLCIA